jgi:phosphoglycerate dehydrogenase-like enzyme
LVHAPTTEELWKEARKAHVAIPFMEAFPKAFFDPQTTPELRLVVQFGVGLEGVDANEATSQGIAVSNVPAEGSGNAQATAEHALYLAISLLRGFPTEDYLSRFPSLSLGGLPIPKTLYRKRTTVVGYGAVGSCLAKYLSALGAKVTVVRRKPWKRNETTDAQDTIHKADTLEEALPTTDILFLACTLTPETLSLVNQTTVKLLPRGALVVNIARGALVDHGAMLSSLESGHVCGFASDVGIGHPTKASEPWDPDDEICNLGPNANVMFTPHVGGYSDASYSVMVQTIADAIEHVMSGEPPPVWVNEPMVND